MNGVLYMLYGIKAPLSIVMLLLSGIIIYVGVFHLKIKLNSNLLKLAIVFYLSYLILGFIVYFFSSTPMHREISHIVLMRGYLSSLIIFLAFYVGTKNLIRKGKLDFLLIMVSSLTFMSVLIAILAPILGLTSAYAYANEVVIGGNRQSGLFNNPNEAGMFACYTIVIALACYSHFKKYTWIFLLMIPFSLYMAFTSFSKTAIIMGVSLFLFYIIYNLKHFKRLRISNSFKTFVFVALCLVFFSFAIKEIVSRVENLTYAQRKRMIDTFLLLSGEVNESTTSERSVIYAHVWKEIQKNPITGHGLGTHHRIMSLPISHKLGPHNTHLLVFAESGIIPILLFVFLYFSLIYAGWRHPLPGIGFLIMGICIAYFFGLAGTGHTALDNRTSNALVGILLVLYKLKPVKVLKKNRSYIAE